MCWSPWWWFWDNEGMDALDSNKLFVLVLLLMLLLIFLLPFPTEQFNSISCEMCFEGLPFPLNIASPEGVDNAGLFGESGEEEVGESGGVLENVVCRIFPLLLRSRKKLVLFVCYNLVSTFCSYEEVGKQTTTKVRSARKRRVEMMMRKFFST